MIDEKALDAAYEEYLAADRYDPYPDVIDILRAAIAAYLDTAAPLPGAGEPVAWTSQSEIDDVATKQRLTALFVSPIVNDSYKTPLYTAAPDTAQAVAAEREACAKAAPASEELCSDCPPTGYPTDETRCAPCPRRTEPETVAVLKMPGNSSIKFEAADLIEAQAAQLAAAKARIAEAEKVIAPYADAADEMDADFGKEYGKGYPNNVTFPTTPRSWMNAARAWREGKP